MTIKNFFIFVSLWAGTCHNADGESPYLTRSQGAFFVARLAVFHRLRFSQYLGKRQTRQNKPKPNQPKPKTNPKPLKTNALGAVFFCQIRSPF